MFHVLLSKIQFIKYFLMFFRMEAEILEATTQELMMHDYPSDCCPEGCYLKFPCIAGDPDSPFWQGWGNLRIKTFRLIENKYFETAVITMILISSLALVMFFFIFIMYLLKMASGETIRRSYECSPIPSLLVCVKNDSSKDRFL